MDPTFSAVCELVSDAVPDLPAVIQGDRTIVWRDFEQRSARLAQAFLDAGLTRHSKVGIYLYNSPEYCETNLAAMKIGAVPINVNYRYLDDELVYLLDNADVEAIVFHRSLSDRLSRIAPRLPLVRLYVEVNDGPPEAEPDPFQPVGYEDIQSTSSPAPRIEPQGDELYMFYTGGTTGMPKGVVYSLSEFTRFFMESYPPMIGLSPVTSLESLIETANRLADEGTPTVAMSGPPLMHGTGCWLGMMAPHLFGGTAVLAEGRSFDAVETWSVVERHGVQHLVIVGDAFAKPMLRALEQREAGWDLSRLGLIVSSGAMFSADVKQNLIEHIPHLAIADVLGATEGGMGTAITTKDTPPTATAQFMLGATSKVFADDDTEVQPGSGVEGRVANGGLVPLEYYKDPEKSARTFQVVNGVRYGFAGDLALVEADGSLTLLGRGSNCINTGGEKVFPEEVEETLKVHPAVEDSLVFGVPDDRFGNRVVAVASLAPGQNAQPDDIVAFAREHLSSYKLPKQITLVPRVPRAPNGKADYETARTMFDSDPASSP